MVNQGISFFVNDSRVVDAVAAFSILALVMNVFSGMVNVVVLLFFVEEEEEVVVVTAASVEEVVVVVVALLAILVSTKAVSFVWNEVSFVHGFGRGRRGIRKASHTFRIWKE